MRSATTGMNTSECLRTQKQKSTGFTPFQLMFGREHQPLDQDLNELAVLPSVEEIHNFEENNRITSEELHSHGGGVLLALKEELEHTQLGPPSWPGGCLEVAAARIGLQRGWLTVVVCYNPGGAATYQELDHYLSSLPPPALVMGDFNAHHHCWDPNLPPLHRHTPGTALIQALQNSPHLCLLSPPGLATRYDPHTGAASVLDLYLGDAAPDTRLHYWTVHGKRPPPHHGLFPADCPQTPPGLLTQVVNHGNSMGKIPGSPEKPPKSLHPTNWGSNTSPPRDTRGGRAGSLPPHHPPHPPPPREGLVE
ncbi:uncharacterized protein LOC126989812 isoform X2 [Eriocheir sinensis]|uniref:uncharacterized protein LOC126989812 isoform X2 n=1 Tax=Eriocheir sinensis TaxID=95602 RepID=UPI0021C97E86|nr:uncharacterized protein LOC126989812 isoform X2 [Eriocheir sinensis]